MVSTATLPLAGYHRQPLCGLETTMAQVQEFETLVRNYQNMVFSVAARIVGSVADAAVSFLFSYRFLEIAGGGVLVEVGLFLLGRQLVPAAVPTAGSLVSR